MIDDRFHSSCFLTLSITYTAPSAYAQAETGNPMQSEDQPSSKRRRIRHSVACEACKVRKSRCELVTAAGCHRCSVLRTHCSLARTGSGSDTDRKARESFSGPSRQAIYEGQRDRRSGSYSNASPRVAVPAPPGLVPGEPMDREQILAAIAEIREYTARIESLSSSVVAAISTPMPQAQPQSRPGSSKFVDQLSPTKLREAERSTHEAYRDGTASNLSESPSTSTAAESSEPMPSHTDAAALLQWTCQGTDDPQVSDFTSRPPFSPSVVDAALAR